MTASPRELDFLVARLARVGDRELAAEAGSPAANALFEQIVSAPEAGHEPRQMESRRRRVVLLAAGLALALAVSVPALGIDRNVRSLFGSSDLEPPARTTLDLVIASGVAGVEWKIIATASDQGLCLGLLGLHPAEGWIGGPVCEPTDVRGDPWASNPRHWIEAFGGGGDLAGASRVFALGHVAEDVADLRLLLSDGTTIRANIIEGPDELGIPIDYYWAAWQCGSSSCNDATGPFISMAIARDAEGRVLERRRPVWNGNPTGDPSGPAPPLD